MENQHRQIKGYRELSQDEIDSMNVVKDLESRVLAALNTMEMNGADPRWSAIARTTLQQGFMAFGRAIARPDSY